MAAYRRVDDSRHLQADCQEPGAAPGSYARQSSMGYLYLCLPECDWLLGGVLVCKQRASLRYLPETCSWSTIGAIVTFATLSVLAAVYLARRH